MRTRPHAPPLHTPTAAGNLERGLVSCTGSQFCGFALIETKNRAMEVVKKLEAALDIPKTVRIHWTGCPNSCGQAQVRGRGRASGWDQGGDVWSDARPARVQCGFFPALFPCLSADAPV